MKLIAIGDTHGRPFWKEIVNNHQFDKIVFIGDYWDSFDVPFEEQAKNFLDIVAYKEANPDKVILLIGNHDYHYTPTAEMFGERYSGYQKKYAMQIGHLLSTHASMFQMTYLYGMYLFTHAGVTKTWMERQKYTGEEPIDIFINDTAKYKPLAFAFNGIDPYGNDKTQSPIWVRPESLMEDAFGDYKQVVGHTSVGEINPEGIYDRFFFIDCLGRSKECLLIENNQVKVLSYVAENTTTKESKTS